MVRYGHLLSFSWLGSQGEGKKEKMERDYDGY